MTELELAIRTIDEIAPDIPTESLKKWKGILTTALLKINKELTATQLHTCKICLLEEWGYRDELPVSWYKKGSAEICFKHNYADSEKLLKESGYEGDAFFPPEVPKTTIESLKTKMNNLPPPTPEAEQTLEELMDLL